jgi:hypothetical protein
MQWQLRRFNRRLEKRFNYLNGFLFFLRFYIINLIYLINRMNLPKSRTDNIVIQNLTKEVLIYDLLTDKAFCLNETSSIIFNACDGKTSFSQLKSETELSDDVIFLALDELKRADLLEKNADYKSPFIGMSRREVIRKVGLGSLAALPIISSLVAPTAANAQSINLSFTCSNSSITANFCVSSNAECTSQAKTLCATCGATASTSGLCSGNPPGGNLITCTCGGACSNPGASTSSFCVSSTSDCSIQSRTLCANCSASVTSGGLCSANPATPLTCTCT